MNRYTKIVTDGLIKNNAALKMVLGTCATLGLSSSASGALGMGLSVTAVLLISNTVISLLKRLIPDMVRIPAFIVLIATLVTLLRMFLDKFLPDLYEAMGVYLPLIVVNCIILGRAESFASKRPVAESALDGLSTGLGYTVAITVMGILRELLGSGALFGFHITDFTVGFFANPSGAFMIYGLLLGLFAYLSDRTEKARRKRHARLLRTVQPLPVDAKEEGHV